MPTQRVWYWYGIKMPGANIIEFEPTAAWNASEHDEFPGSDHGPHFAGTIQATPDITFTTRQIKDLFDQTTIEDVAEGVGDVSNGVKLWQRAGQPYGMREANDDLNNRNIEITTQCMLCWESLSASQGAVASVQARLNVAYDGVNEPYLWLGEAEDIPADPASTPALWTLGPVKWTPQKGATPTAQFVGGVTDLRWDNRITREEQYSDGDPFPSYQGIRQLAPQITLTTTNRTILDLFEDATTPNTQRGIEVQNLIVYLRRMDHATIQDPDTDSTHVSITCPTAIAYPTQVSANPNEVQLLLRPYKVAGTPLFTIDTATPIT